MNRSFVKEKKPVSIGQYFVSAGPDKIFIRHDKSNKVIYINRESFEIGELYDYNEYLNPCELLKMATTNICDFKINDVVQKSIIEEQNFAEFIIFKSFSKNPYLNICNRCETKNILYTINKKVSI